LIKLAASGLLVLVALFCAVGFMATFEVPGSIEWRIGYGFVGLACVGAAAWIVFSGSWRHAAMLVLLLVAAFCAWGLIATFEPPGAVAWRIGFGMVGLACVGVALWLWYAARKSKDGSR
jgi:hypothetical protein